MKVLIFANGELASVLKGLVAEKTNYHLLGVTSSKNELLRLYAEHKRFVVVLDVTENPTVCHAMMSLIVEKNLKALTICRDVRHGFKVLNEGATEMIVAPQSLDAQGLKHFGPSLLAKISKVYREYDSSQRDLKHHFTNAVNKIVAIGSSTGGTEIILQILKAFPKDMVPVLIVQHMPPVFTKMYAQRLNSICNMSVWEAQDGDELRPGLALVAPGELQMRVCKKNGKHYVTCTKEANVEGHSPSVDVMFHSMATNIAKNGIGVILTGMGSDGAKGMLEMRKSGAFTIGQDQRSSMVYSMPKVAYELGGVTIQSNPSEIAQRIMEKL